MNYDPSGHFVISLGTLITGIIIGAVTGAGIGLGSAIIKDLENGKLFDGDVTFLSYFGNALGGGIAGAGLGIATVLGATAGTAALVGSSATLLTSGGLSVTFGSALAKGTGTAFVTGMAGYAARVAIDPAES